MPAHPTQVREPSLAELVAEPIVQAVMASDGVAPETLEELIHSAARQSRDRKPGAAGAAWRRRDAGHDRRAGS